MERVPPQLQALHQEYPWLSYHPETITTYLPPDYYDKLLKPYTFGGRSDLDYLLGDVNARFQPNQEEVLEMGFGSGRATDALIASGKGFNRLDLLDLSKDMVDQARVKYSGVPGLNVVEGDILDFLQATSQSYSYAFSLWGFSYSVHHHMNEIGIRDGARFAENVISKFIIQNLKPNGSIFIVHPDILSDEQRILKSLRQPTVSKTKDRQSSSKRVLDATIDRLERLCLAKAEVTHLEGDSIHYSSVDEALEIFLNFHMHGSLNRSRRLPRAIDTLKTEFAKHQQGGEVLISPGCFNYSITSLG